MIPAALRTRYRKLLEEINRHRHLYYVQDTPEIEDSAYDELEKELFALEEKYPGLIAPDSPSRRVGGLPLPQFKKVRHAVPQWSFNDAFSADEMREFDVRVKRFLKSEFGDATPTYTCELKKIGRASCRERV